MITSIKEFKNISEGVIVQPKDKEIFNYNNKINDLWRPIIKKAQEFQHINFDLENNDSIGQKKRIYIKKNLRKDQPVKYEFNVELFRAGGDWEQPVMYFKVELTTDYNIVYFGRQLAKPEYVWDIKTDDVSGLTKHYVLIPGPENGNFLKKTETGYTAFTSDDPKVKITDKQEKMAWKWLEKLLRDVVDKRHRMLDDTSIDIKKTTPDAISESLINDTDILVDEKKLLDAARSIAYLCNGEYGQTYWNKDQNHVYVCLGDSSPFNNDMFTYYLRDTVCANYMTQDEIIVTIENECQPNDEEDGWLEFNGTAFIPYVN